MTRQHRYSHADCLTPVGLTTTLITATPFFWAPPLWILALLQEEANDR